ncbi:hypothetical protein Ddye_024736 [Dipteronia dyeriana]|uniref:RNase H type-1 domain-containing protein n=1 Tax=Dipteronia dyeriana TaxID=168575 RepID=A0AAD9TW12_9ROSI|nr:hypothetical protein Ddye_024736 [Dipteronia dyeriana]
MDSWTGLCPTPNQAKAWSSLFCAVVWIIWEARNHLVFDGKQPRIEKMADEVKFRVAWWFKHLGKGYLDSVDALLCNVKQLCLEPKVSKKSKIADWISPSNDSLKFNVDGSSRGKPGHAGIGGILRDSKGKKVLCLFSFYMGFLYSNTAELCAIRRAVELCIQTWLCEVGSFW